MSRSSSKAKSSAGTHGSRSLKLPPPIRSPRGRHRPPPLNEVAQRLEPFCRKHGITRLDIFGSVARGDARVGSDVDLIASFAEQPGLNIVSIETECAKLLGAPVHLVTSELVAEITNPYRRESIQRDRRTIYDASLAQG